jgi:hypothetical protein
MDLVATGEGHASIVVDARDDRRNVWWALIKHRVSQAIDVERLAQPGWELRVEARVRTSHAPRRVNLHVHTQRTTDFHSHLMEFDLPVAGVWHTISMTPATSPVPATPCSPRWRWTGAETPPVDRLLPVDVVEAAAPALTCRRCRITRRSIRFLRARVAAEVAVVDRNPVSTRRVVALRGSERVLTVNATMRRKRLASPLVAAVAGQGLLEPTTATVQRRLGNEGHGLSVQILGMAALRP